MKFRSNRNPQFRSQFSESIFEQKYAHEGAETWSELAATLVEDVAQDKMTPDEKGELTKFISDLKFVPGGRYLYYAGRPAKFFNNCFSGDQNVLTSRGWVNLAEHAGEEVLVYSPVDNVYYPAIIHNHGKQPMREITFAPVRGKSKIRYKVKATPDHRWILADGSETTTLKVGDVVPSNSEPMGYNDNLGFVHGFMFGDGTRNGQLRLCADKDLEHLEELAKWAHSVTYPDFAGGDPCLYFNQNIPWKSLPELDSNPAYISSFIRGWIAADGSKGRILSSVNKEALEWFRKHAAYAGLVITGDLRYQDRDIKIGNYEYLNHRIYTQNYSQDKWPGFKVVQVEEVDDEVVYCPEEPVHGQIIIDHNIVTGNCYLLRAEEDTRQDWANLSWKAESALMTGGGIGVDYSVYRAEGSPLGRTGGTASGPIPKMQMINEIGRRVMQGGSRRSAIYASLNWKHGDVYNFLGAKNWQDTIIPGTGVSLKDVKAADFNFPAPLDMTNISVNYDTEWLLNYWKTGDVGDVFRANVRQALSTAEPGFSFNFFDKERETLRNAPVSGDTWVMTSGGYVQIKDIVGREVRVWTGQQWATTTFKKTKESVPTLVVSITGGRTIKADPEHEFFVERYSGKGARRKLTSIDKVRADQLRAGDVLHTPLPKERPDPINGTDIYVLGYAYGDGSFNRYGADITFCSDASKSLAERIPFTLTRLGTVNWSDKRGYVRAYVKNCLFKDRSKSVYPYGERLGPEFFAGLFDADGCYSSDQNRIRLSSIHYDFLEGVRRDLEFYGIQSTITKAGISTYGRRQGYSLVIMGSSVSRFADMIPTLRLKVQPHKPYRDSLVKVLSVAEGPIEDVFCCDVGVPEHSFCADGVIISNCTEVTSEDDSDVCNLGSINMGRIDSIEEFRDIVELATKFLVCGTLRADLPYQKVHEVREKNRRLGLGLMGMHEWLIKRGMKYEVTPELHRWLAVYRGDSDRVGDAFADSLGLSRPVAKRAIAPTGSIGILAGTTTGVEPLFAVAYKRRYLKGKRWHYQYTVDGAAQELIDLYGADPNEIETALDLAAEPERRIKFQADVQDYVDQSISSTINLPSWGSASNNEDTVDSFADTLARYSHRLRGFTCYPDGSRGGQPLTSVPYADAREQLGQVFEEAIMTHDICEITGHGGSCGV